MCTAVVSAEGTLLCHTIPVIPVVPFVHCSPHESLGLTRITGISHQRSAPWTTHRLLHLAHTLFHRFWSEPHLQRLKHSNSLSHTSFLLLLLCFLGLLTVIAMASCAGAFSVESSEFSMDSSVWRGEFSMVHLHAHVMEKLM